MRWCYYNPILQMRELKSGGTNGLSEVTGSSWQCVAPESVLNDYTRPPESTVMTVP